MKKINKIAMLSFLASISIFSTSQAVAQEKNYALENVPLEITNDVCDVMVNIPQLYMFEEQDNPNLRNLLQNFNATAVGNLTEIVENWKFDLGESNSLALEVDSPAEFELFLLSKIADYDKIRELSAQKYTLYSSWKCYMNKYIATVCQDSYIFVGGAHGAQTITMNSYLLYNGQEINFADQIVDTTYFMDAVVKYFCKERKLEPTATKSHTGLFYELADLPMPKTIGLDKRGLAVVYDEYEIAPYAAGLIKVVIPFKEFDGIFGKEFTRVTVKRGGREYKYDEMH